MGWFGVVAFEDEQLESGFWTWGPIPQQPLAPGPTYLNRTLTVGLPGKPS